MPAYENLAAYPDVTGKPPRRFVHLVPDAPEPGPSMAEVQALQKEMAELRFLLGEVLRSLPGLMWPDLDPGPEVELKLYRALDPKETRYATRGQGILKGIQVEAWLSTSQSSELLGLGKDYVRDACSRRELTHYRTNDEKGKILIPYSYFDRWRQETFLPVPAVT